MHVADIIAHASESEAPDAARAEEAVAAMNELGIAPAKFEALRLRTRERYNDAMAKA